MDVYLYRRGRAGSGGTPELGLSGLWFRAILWPGCDRQGLKDDAMLQA